MAKKGRGAKVAATAVTLVDIERAAAAIRGHVATTRCEHSRTLSDILGAEIWLKFENLQYTGAYKERGALNRLLALSDEERARGVVAMSAGNHAQGVAYHAGRLSIPATIVMPEGTPTVKLENTRRFGATVIEMGASLDAARRFALSLGAERGLTFIHPYDDPLVIAGQGTVALEMLASVPALDLLVVPVGGGGLVAGMATAAKALRPDIEVVGVEAALYPSMLNLLRDLSLPVGGDTLAEGIAVETPGKLTSAIVQRLVDDMLLVSEPEIERAVSLLINIEKTVVEGAGAAGLAAIVGNREAFRGKKVGVVLAGGNIDARLLAGVLTRELAREGRLSRLTIDIPDRPRELARVATLIGEAGANIVEVYHQRVFTDLPAKGTELNLVIETRDPAHTDRAVEALARAGYRVIVKGAPGP